MRSAGPVAATLGVVVLTGCSLLQGADASSPARVVSGPGAGDLFVHGQVLRDGDPVAGAEVSLVIEDLGAAGEPTAYDVPAVTTGDDGGHAFAIDPDELPARFRVGEDYVKFDVSVVEGTDRSAWSSTVWLVDSAAGWRSQGADVDDAVPAVSFELGHGTVQVTDSSGESATYGE
ncbi:MAG: hypothetical protein ACRDOZ_00405 [Nocardioides sp.]